MTLQETMLSIVGGLIFAAAMFYGLAWWMARGHDRRSPDDENVIDAIRKWREGR